MSRYFTMDNTGEASCRQLADPEIIRILTERN